MVTYQLDSDEITTEFHDLCDVIFSLDITQSKNNTESLFDHDESDGSTGEEMGDLTTLPRYPSRLKGRRRIEREGGKFTFVLRTKFDRNRMICG